MNESDRLTISLTGEALTKSVNLHMLGTTLINIQALFDRSYCYYTGRSRMSAIDRSNFNVVAYDIKRGSIIFDAGLDLIAVQQSLIIGQTIDPKLILEGTLSGFKLLKEFFSKIVGRNDTPKVQIINSPHATCVYQEGKNTFMVSEDTMSIAQGIRAPLRRISQALHYGADGAIEIASLNNINEPICLDHKTSQLFKGKRMISNIPLQISGIVCSYSADSYIGLFEVMNGLAIPSGRYPFKINKDYQSEARYFIDSLNGVPIGVTAFVEYEVSLDMESTITRLFLAPRQASSQSKGIRREYPRKSSPAEDIEY